ncbi:Uncharacterized protein FWK35_00024273 [Aphis craccivora]|uniref:Uncharacterized protein n=1 Tax=Aphis craccivora TaxID=307492 RepID=A0A6G0YXZ3_APHCR|nr:Uncharacterized protein FWK35_00024273 [Aphis craccivora]
MMMMMMMAVGPAVIITIGLADWTGRATKATREDAIVGGEGETASDCGKRRDKWKRHEFGDFLTENEVSAALAKAILELCRAEKRPSDPIEFIRVRMLPNNEDLTEIQSYPRRKIIDKTQHRAAQFDSSGGGRQVDRQK